MLKVEKTHRIVQPYEKVDSIPFYDKVCEAFRHDTGLEIPGECLFGTKLNFVHKGGEIVTGYIEACRLVEYSSTILNTEKTRRVYTELWLRVTRYKVIHLRIRDREVRQKRRFLPFRFGGLGELDLVKIGPSVRLLEKKGFFQLPDGTTVEACTETSHHSQ